MYDCIVIGGGPAGLTAAIYLKRACKSVMVLEKEIFGGQITKASLVENYPGCPKVSGMELGNNMYQQVKDMDISCFYEEVISVKREEDLFLVKTNKNEYQSKTVICATGTSPRKLEVPKENFYIGKGLSYCATCDGAFFKDKVVCVVGGGNTAMDDALYLSNVCNKVYVIHRNENLRAEPLKISMVKEKENVEFIYNAVVKEIVGEEKMEKIILDKNGTKMEVSTDGLFVAIGSTPNLSLLKDLESFDSKGYALESSVSGLFLAGDVRDKPIRQLTTATCDGTVAAIYATNYLNAR